MMNGPTAMEEQQLGAALARAIRAHTAWPIRLEIMDLKHEIVGFSPANEEVFRINIPGRWL